MKPLFEVGEVVTVIGRSNKNLGDAVIEGMKYFKKDVPLGECDRWGYKSICDGYQYWLSPDPDGRPDIPWPEQNLRKKHKPGDSFKKIMEDLKTPIHERV